MGFQDVKLPSALISEMYKRVLIEEPAVASETLQAEPANEATSKHVAEVPTQPAAAPSNKEALKFLGSNSKNISLIASGKKILSESSPETMFLLKILQACSLSMKDIALFDNSQVKMSISDLVEEQQPQKLLIFSTEINNTAIPPELLFQVQKERTSEILYAPMVQELMKDSAEAVNLKKKLWAALKNFFNV